MTALAATTRDDELITVIAAALERHEVEYIPDLVLGAPYSGFYECGCNEYGTVGPLVGPAAKWEHQARGILAALQRHGAVTA